MVLVGVRKQIDATLSSYATAHTPSLVIDCGKSLDLVPPYFPRKITDGVFLLRADLLYTFRDVLREVKPIAKSLGIEHIIITAFHLLFNFEDILENNQVITEAWELLQELGKDFTVLVGVHPNQEGNALRYCG